MEACAMKRRGWWIFGGILLLWISPVFYAVIRQGFFPERKDQTEAWARYWHNERMRKTMEERNFYRTHGLSGYRVWPRDDRATRTEIVYVDRPLIVDRVVERVVERPSHQSRPDLSGIYTTIPLSGPDLGKVRFDAVDGPE
jgi:hypothetical protein